MAKRKAPGWAGFPEGAVLSLALYIVFQCLLALLTIKGVLPEEVAFRFQVASGVIAACCGGMLAIRRTGVGTLWAAMGSAAIFAVMLVLGGLLVCDGVVWSRESIILLVGALAGGFLASLLGGRGKKKHKQPAPPVRRAKVGKKA